MSVRLYVLVCASSHHHAFTVHVHACSSFACVLHTHAPAVKAFDDACIYVSVLIYGSYCGEVPLAVHAFDECVVVC